MKTRPPELLPQSVRDVELALRTPSLSRAVDDLATYLRVGGSEPRFFSFSEQELAAIHRLAHQRNDDNLDEREFIRQMNATRPLAAMPQVTDSATDLWFTLAQSEILEHLWPAVESRTGRTGRDPGFAAKAFLFFVASQGVSPHFDDNHRALRADHRARAVFEWVEASSAAARGTRPRTFSLATYEQTLRQMHLVAEGVDPYACIETNVALVREAHKLLGIKKTYIGIDGMLWQAWVEQIGTRPDREETIRRVAREATPILIERDGFPEFIRGYRFVAFVDLLTGLPLVWTLWPGRSDEARALEHLLELLYGLWPDIAVDAIVADSAWDERWAAELCLARYGVPLVAHRKPSQLGKSYPLTRFESEGISHFLGDGTLFCRKHNVPLQRDGFEMAPRERSGRVLSPGEEANPEGFRLRAHCPISAECRRRSLRMSSHWTSLAPFPHSSAAGQKDRHALRVALSARRNANESLHSAIKTSAKLGLRGAGRQRTAKEPTVKAELSLALTLRSAFFLAALRVERGLFPEAPPPDLAATLSR